MHTYVYNIYIYTHIYMFIDILNLITSFIHALMGPAGTTFYLGQDFGSNGWPMS